MEVVWVRSAGDINLYARRIILDHFLAGAYQRDACDLLTDLMIALCWASGVEERLAGPLPGVAKELLLMAVAQHHSDNAFLPRFFDIVYRKVTLRTLSVPSSQDAPSTPSKRGSQGHTMLGKAGDLHSVDWGRVEMRWIARELALFIPLTAVAEWHQRSQSSRASFFDYVTALLSEEEDRKEEQAVMCHILRSVLSVTDEESVKVRLLLSLSLFVSVSFLRCTQGDRGQKETADLDWILSCWDAC